jgi:chorismate mutase
MSQEELATLRAEVDRIDGTIVDLLVERLAVVRRIALVKGDSGNGRVAIRPAREAVILRRLAERADGGFPKAPLIRMWRELLAATTRAQAPLNVLAHVPEEMPELWDLARDHFGSLTALARAQSASEAVRAVADGKAQVAVLPLPGDADRWWLGLVDDDPSSGPRIVARLPFAGGAHHPAEVGAVVLARLDQEPSGDDLTLLAIEAEAELSRAKLKDALEAAGLEPRWLAAVRPGEGAAAIHLIEIQGFVGDRDPALANALQPLRRLILRVTPLGGYARPFTAAELA